MTIEDRLKKLSEDWGSFAVWVATNGFELSNHDEGYNADFEISVYGA
jgi:hypothetical protein